MVRITLLNKVMVDVPDPTPPVVDALELTFDDIANVPVADAASVTDWNTFFDLPTNGSPFTSAEVVGDMVRLIGGSGITVKEYLFYENLNLIKIIDNTGCIIQINIGACTYCTNLNELILPNVISIYDGAFAGCVSLLSVSLPVCEFLDIGIFNACKIVSLSCPNVTYMGDGCLYACDDIETIYTPSLLDLGSTVGDDSVFFLIIGQTITLTIPAALMTCNAGEPDGDIQYLQANNTVTIVTV